MMKKLAICKSGWVIIVADDNHDRSCWGYCCCFGDRIVSGQGVIVICIDVIGVNDDRYFIKDSRI